MIGRSVALFAIAVCAMAFTFAKLANAQVNDTVGNITLNDGTQAALPPDLAYSFPPRYNLFVRWCGTHLPGGCQSMTNLQNTYVAKANRLFIECSNGNSIYCSDYWSDLGRDSWAVIDRR